MVTGSASGKVILFGEHAVVYGRPAIAVPVAQLQATATVTPASPGYGIALHLPDIGDHVPVTGLATERPLAQVIQHTVKALELSPTPDWTITVHSDIPVASGLGSGAAVATAIVRAMAAAADRKLSPDQVSAIVFEGEKLFHGTPSGIDNTVVAFEQPVWFIRTESAQPFPIAASLSIVIGDSGIASPTSVAVGDVRQAWQNDQEFHDTIFDAISDIVHAARTAMENGDMATLGNLMDLNHRLLQRLKVSSPELNILCDAARAAGALGAKLSGGGRGGNMIALVQSGQEDSVVRALRKAGAVRTITTVVESVPEPVTRPSL
ncbi:MAG: mevalonate kinase [Chloroflexota bacterium]|nr:mevalonate kinase [Chloroflexota bacterium]